MGAPGSDQGRRGSDERTDDLARVADSDALAVLYERLAPSLHVWASLRIPRSHQACLGAEDVLQEVWFRAATLLKSFDPAQASFRAWLFGVAKNVLLEATRQLRRPDVLRRVRQGESSLFALDQVPETITGISHRVARDESVKQLIDWLHGLDRQDRDLVLHCGLEDLRHDAVATLLDLPTETVTKRWQRLRKRLESGGLPPDLVASLSDRG